MGIWKISKMWIMALLLVVFVAGCGREQGVVFPTLTAINPNRGTQGQTVPVTLTGTNFTTGATINLSGTLITISNATVVSSNQITATFAIAANAVVGTVNVSVTSSGMTTNTVPFTIGPPLTVISTIPIGGADGVPINQVISATFSQAVSCATVTASSFTLTGPGGAVAGATTCSGATVTFTPTSLLTPNTSYHATLTTAIMTSVGDPLLSNFVWSFATAPPLLVNSTVPTNGATGVLINQLITVNFNQLVNCSTVTASTFTVAQTGGAAVAGTVVCIGTSATSVSFVPTSNLAINTNFTATITTGVTDLGGAGLASNYVWGFRTGATPDTIPPTVTAVTPLNLATGVGFNTAITAMFDEAMNPATMIGSTFMLATGCAPAGALVGGAVTYNPINNIITLIPTSPLAPLTCYTATVTTGAENLSGTHMAANFVWTFTTGAAPDITPPTVISTNPLNHAINVPLNQLITATFSEPMLDTTINTTTFTLAQGGTPVPGTVGYIAGSNTARFVPNSNLVLSTLYTATITTGVTDLAGNHMVAIYVWTFTTAGPLATPPTVVSTNPANNASGVCTNGINATFSTAMDPATINNATFMVTAAGLPVAGTFSMDVTGTIATFTPLSNLAPSTTYVVTITTGVTDLAGNALASQYVWSFTTGAALVCAPPSPLGAAAPFGAFGGGAGMTNQGINTVINGDIGTTGVSTTMTGFHDTTEPYIQFSSGCIYTETTLNVGTVNGEIFTDPPPPTITCPNEGTGPATLPGTTAYVALQAYNAAVTEFNALAAMPTTGPDPGAATSENLGGLTIHPGVYASASGAYAISGSDLTLDAQGNANAVFVFQMGTSLTVGLAGAPRSVILINGAKATNVYWQVGSATTINAAGGGTFVGTVISSAGIAVSTAGNAAITTINGRLIALHASTTLVNTVINVPAP